VSRRRLAALALVAGVLAAGCRVQADVAITVEEEGTGEVVVAVTLDQEAAERIPDLATQMEDTDLTDAGWTVSEVEATPDGGATVSASKPYGSPEQLGAVLAEVSGEDGPFAELGLERTHELAETEWVLSGEVDATGGVQAFSDDELAALLGGQPLGYDLDALGQELGQPVDELVEWSLTADFTEADTVAIEPPGQPESDSNLGPGEMARWTGSFADDEPTTVAATASRVDTTTRILAAVAALALFLLVVLLLFRLVRRRRRRKRERREQAEAAAATVGQPARAGLEGTSVRPLAADPPTTELPVVTPPADAAPAPPPTPSSPPSLPSPPSEGSGGHDTDDDLLYEDDPDPAPVDEDVEDD
jgi:hypothetical protein